MRTPLQRVARWAARIWALTLQKVVDSRPWRFLTALWELGDTRRRLTSVEMLASKAECDAREALGVGSDALKTIRDRTEISVSWHGRDPRNFVVLVGRYKNTDYVEIIPLGTADFESVVRNAERELRRTRFGFLDAPPGFKAVLAKHRVPVVVNGERLQLFDSEDPMDSSRRTNQGQEEE
jgi:hypothetical protein